jgi:hypothetical protein
VPAVINGTVAYQLHPGYKNQFEGYWSLTRPLSF